MVDETRRLVTTHSKGTGARGGAQGLAGQALRRVLEARRGQGRALPVVEIVSHGNRVGEVLAYVLETCREDQWGDLLELMFYR
jgi:hypothetical protein